MKRIIPIFAALILSVPMFAQNYRVKGTVVDAQGPVIGASVVEQGTLNGIVTDLDGAYELSVSSAGANVEISCIGYATQTFKASELPATILLEEDRLLLEDVVVIGYGTVKKGDMTGSVVAIKADEVNRGAVSSPDQMLLGKVSGLRVVPATGQPGASATIRIRGTASLSASNDPLIVIDGVPITKDGGAGMGNPLSSVNPNDIESYSVLKDASATAIYGSRASNGVIIITTKKGVGNKIQVSYDGSASVKQNYSTLDMMDAEQFKSFIAANYPKKNDPKFIGDANTDWQNEIYRLGIQTDHNVTVKGGGKFPFRASLGYNLDQATLKVGDNQRANADLSFSPKFLDEHLSVNVNLKGVYQYTNWANSGAIGNALAFNPTMPTHFEDGTFWNWYTSEDRTNANTQASTNPLSNLYEYIDWNRGLRTISNIQLDYKVHGFEELRFNINAGIDYATTNGEHYNQLGCFSSLGAGASDYAVQYVNRNRNALIEMYADWNHDFGWSTLDVMGGYSWQHNFVQYDSASYYNREDRWNEANLYQKNPTNSKEYYLISFFGRVNWSVGGKYLFTATLRDDASSRFAPQNRWGLFPSLAFAWNIAEEDFLKGGELSQLKLRLGWGQTGQQDIGDDYYPYLARYTESSVLNMMYNMGNGNYNTLAPNPYNPNIKWETTTTWNAGLDFGLRDDVVTGSVEAYYRHTTDLLNSIAAPLGGNFSNVITANIGEMVNKGIELTANWNIIETRDLHLSLGGNVTFQDTKITKLTAKHDESYLGVTVGSKLSGTDGYSSLFREGYAPYTYHLYKQSYFQGKPVQNGLEDLTPDGVINADDRYITPWSPEPSVFYGVNLHFGYKDWDFSINGHGSAGNYLINKVALGYSSSYSDDTDKGYLNNLSNVYLKEGWTAANSTEQFYSDLFVENASFLKIDDINLGRTFKLDKKWIKSFRLAASVQNVCTFTKYSGLDPEISNADGVDGNIIPRPRLYTIRFNINF